MTKITASTREQLCKLQSKCIRYIKSNIKLSDYYKVRVFDDCVLGAANRRTVKIYYTDCNTHELCSPTLRIYTNTFNGIVFVLVIDSAVTEIELNKEVLEYLVSIRGLRYNEQQLTMIDFMGGSDWLYIVKELDKFIETTNKTYGG